MKNPLTDDGLYLITKPSNTGGLVAMAFKVEKSHPHSWASGKRVLWTWTNGGAPFDYVYGHMGHDRIVEAYKEAMALSHGKIKTQNKPQPIAFVDNTGIWVFQRLKFDPKITGFIEEVMSAITFSCYNTPLDRGLRLSILDSEEDRIAEAVANDPDVQAIRDLVARLGKKEE